MSMEFGIKSFLQDSQLFFGNRIESVLKLLELPHHEDRKKQSWLPDATIVWCCWVARCLFTGSQLTNPFWLHLACNVESHEKQCTYDALGSSLSGATSKNGNMLSTSDCFLPNEAKRNVDRDKLKSAKTIEKHEIEYTRAVQFSWKTTNLLELLAE